MTTSGLGCNVAVSKNTFEIVLKFVVRLQEDEDEKHEMIFYFLYTKYLSFTHLSLDTEMGFSKIYKILKKIHTYVHTCGYICQPEFRNHFNI